MWHDEAALFAMAAALAVAVTWIRMYRGARSRAAVISLSTLAAVVLAMVVLTFSMIPLSSRNVGAVCIAGLAGVGPLAAVGSVVASWRVGERRRELMLVLGFALSFVLAPLFVIISALIVLVSFGDPWVRH